MEERWKVVVCPGDSCHVCRVGGRYLEPALIAWSKWGWGKETASLPLHPCSQPGPGCPGNLHPLLSFFTVWTPRLMVVLHSTLPLSKLAQIMGQGHRVMGSGVLLAEDGVFMGNLLILQMRRL